MIPAALIADVDDPESVVVDLPGVAALYEYSLQHVQALGIPDRIPGELTRRAEPGRPAGRRRLWPRAEVVALRDTERGERTYDEPDGQVPGDERDATTAGTDPLDLLDLEEARWAIPEDRRPARQSWRAMVYELGTGPKVAATVHGVDHFRRGEVEAWDASRNRAVGGKGRRPSAEVARRRRERLAELLAADPKVSSVVVAEELGITRVRARAVLAEARKAKAQASEPQP